MKDILPRHINQESFAPLIQEVKNLFGTSQIVEELTQALEKSTVISNKFYQQKITSERMVALQTQGSSRNCSIL